MSSRGNKSKTRNDEIWDIELAIALSRNFVELIFDGASYTVLPDEDVQSGSPAKNVRCRYNFTDYLRTKTFRFQKEWHIALQTKIHGVFLKYVLIFFPAKS